jgi:hypoxanthine phosphoribosyltransferase
MDTRIIEGKEFIEYDWKDVEECCKKIADYLVSNTFPNSILIGVGKGGLIPATIVANMVSAGTLHTIGIKSYYRRETAKGSNSVVEVPGSCTVYQWPTESRTRVDNIILIDDLADTGDTFVKIVEEFKKDLNFKNASVQSCALAIKKSTTFIPTFYVHTHHPQSWVNFPWERNRHTKYLNSVIQGSNLAGFN